MASTCYVIDRRRSFAHFIATGPSLWYLSSDDYTHCVTNLSFNHLRCSPTRLDRTRLNMRSSISMPIRAVHFVAALAMLVVPAIGSASKRQDCSLYNGLIALGDGTYIGPPFQGFGSGTWLFAEVSGADSAGVFEFQYCGENPVEVVVVVSHSSLVLSVATCQWKLTTHW